MKFSDTKKIVIASLLTLLSFTTEAQWQENYYVDDFGDKTTEKYESMSAVGTFSNSAVQNADAKYTFIKDQEYVLINVYEYGRSLATNIDATFEVVKVKQPNGNIVSIKRVFFTKSGKLLFSKKNYALFLDVIKDSGDYVMVFDRSGKYSSSKYKVKFTID